MAKRGRAVNTQMPSEKATPIHGSGGHAIEQYDCAPFSRHPHDVGSGGIPVKIFESHGERLPKDHTGAQTSAMSAKGTPPPGQRRFGKAL